MEEPATASAVTGSFKDQVSMRSIWLLSRNITNTSVTIPGLLLPSLVGMVYQEILQTKLMKKYLPTFTNLENWLTESVKQTKKKVAPAKVRQERVTPSDVLGLCSGMSANFADPNPEMLLENSS